MKHKLVTYKDLLTIKEYNQNTNKEDFVFLPTEDKYVVGKNLEDRNMLEYSEKIAVRKTVYKKLLQASKLLKQQNKDYKLMVVYGFRDMKLQKEYFNEILETVENKFVNKMDMYEYIHTKVAIPEVAGHPTGGAIDIAIYNDQIKEIIDFGSDILDWDDENCCYDALKIGKIAKLNRKLLRKIMLDVGFAPYNGEWWHFSYGDKEWAYYYKKKKALYNQVKAEEIFKQVEYMNFIPGGNKTALVLNNDYSDSDMKLINDEILSKDATIEQVGFLNNKGKYELKMAGGEFCGNATRSAVFYYLKGNAGKLKIKVNSKDIIEAEVSQNKEVICEMPIIKNSKQVKKLDDDIYMVKLNGMTSIIVEENLSKKYLSDKENLKNIGMKFIEKYNLKDREAVGVIFLENENGLKIHPIVWVKKIDTLFYETACGSGTIATAMVKTFISGQNQILEILQPSGMIIKSNTKIKNNIIYKASISGQVKSDFQVKRLIILNKRNIN